MAVKVTCPVCRSKIDLRCGEISAEIDELVSLAAKFGPDWALVTEYTETFRGAQWAATMALKKRLRLLKEVWRLFERQAFEYDGRRYRATRKVICAGMQIVANAEKWGLRNHNYLKKCMLSCGAERLSREGLTAEEETQREQKRRDRSSRRDAETQRLDCPNKSGNDNNEDISAAEFKGRKGIESLADNIGKTIE